MKTKITKNAALKVIIVSVLMAFACPVTSSAQWWKFWKKKKKEKKENVEVVNVNPEENVDTLQPVTFVMQNTEKSDSVMPFANYSTVAVNDKVVNVDGAEIKLVCVQGGTFIMGKTPDQFNKSEVDEYPPHRVALNSYYISTTEVTQELWKKVMGNNPAHFKNVLYPVESVSWNDCQRFIQKLNQKTGLTFRLPTEAEWEYAARGGVLSGQWHFAGSDNLDAVAWTAANASSSNYIAMKLPNELGLYDMCGNVAEWCYDWYGEYKEERQTNPVGPEAGTNRVVRGGHWIDGSNAARVAFRFSLPPNHSNYNTGLRLVCEITQNDIQQTADNPQEKKRGFEAYNTQYLNEETYRINNVEFKMVGVQGGAFLMGATLEQVKDADVDEQPCHNVAISSFRIGQTEVTQGLWKAVMGSCPAKFKGDNLPVENVSWDDCHAFIEKLNAITGKQFRLPTESEWEYAARGGNLSMMYEFPGSDNVYAVAWNAHTTSSPKPVAQLEPNELGIYDMGGNIAEWCEDWYFPYMPQDATNPKGPDYSYNKVIRGSYWEDGMRYCHSSYRYSQKTTFKSYNVGFRLAL